MLGTVFTLTVFTGTVFTWENLNMLHTLSLCYVPVAFDMFGERQVDD